MESLTTAQEMARRQAAARAVLILGALLSCAVAGTAPDRPGQLHAALKAANPDYANDARLRVEGGVVRWVDLRGCRVTDLSPLKGLPVEGLGLGGLAVTDLSPLLEMPLKRLAVSPDKVNGDLSILRQHKTLEHIGLDGPLEEAIIPVERFWQAVAAGEDPFRLVAALDAHPGGVFAVALRPDGSQIASGGADGRVKVWDRAAGRWPLVLEGHKGAVRAVAYWEHLYSAGDDGTVRVWDADTGECLTTLDGKIGALTSLGFCDCEGAVYAGGRSGVLAAWGDEDWQDAARGRLEPPDGERRPILSMASPGCHYLATATGSLTLWTTHEGEPFRTLRDEGRRILCSAFPWDGRTLVTGGDRLLVWDVRHWQPAAALDAPDLPLCCLAGAWDAPALLVTGSERGTVALWGLEARKCLWSVAAHAKAVRAVEVSAAGDRIASASEDGTIRIWAKGPPDPLEAYEADRREAEALTARARQQTVSLDLAEASLAEVVRALTDQGGLTVLADWKAIGDPPPTVTLKAKGIALSEAVDRIAKAAGLVHSVRDGAIVLTKPTEPAARPPDDPFAGEPDLLPPDVVRRFLWPWGEKLDAQAMAALSRPITFDFVDTPLADVLPFLASLTGCVVAVGPGAVREPEAVCTLRVREMRLDHAMRWIAHAGGLTVVWLDHGFLFARPSLALDAIGKDRRSRPLQRVADEAPAAALAKPVSFDFVETPLEDALDFLHQHAGLPIILDVQALRGEAPTVTLRLTDTRTDAALRWACRLSGLVYVWHDGAIFVSTWYRAWQTMAWDKELREPQQPPTRELGERLAKKTGFHLVETPLQDFVTLFEQHTGVAVRIDRGAVRDEERLVTLRVTDMPWGQALRWACRLTGLVCLWRDGQILITTAERARGKTR